MEQTLSHDFRTHKESLLHLLRNFSVEHREVTLASGQTSSFYLDCRQIYFRGEAHFLIGEIFWQKLIEIEKKHECFMSACGGMAMGCIPLSLALSAAAFRRGRELPGFAVRKEAKEHGMQSIIEGSKCLKPHSQVVIVEDVVTTGGSALKAIEQLRTMGMVVHHMLAIVDRNQGGKERLAKEHVELESIFNLNDILE
ncbi:MAG: orotate phosphoribosyltransferase [Myxococcales bacterium]|nr:orotate phosphoribosyltransferase [Myxococcales bacterium]USN51622.1 MAG: orotate phosphoribosyltransferase [Myxococcales bacterium]